MQIILKISELKKALDVARRGTQKVGIVPTMGALHKGHFSLIEAALANNDFIVLTIFVNPTQFNDLNDLERYPRNLEKDIAHLEKYHIDILFTPSEKEMYPEKDTRVFKLSPLDKIMEGLHRPGHFNGVAQIISKLFEIVRPDRAYFGQKDFQQLAIIKHLTKQLELNVEIIGCPIVREKDGLAMSSRNQLLNAEERKAAPLINKILIEAEKMHPSMSPEEISSFVVKHLNSHPLMKVEYFEIVDDQSLMPISSWDDSTNKIACVAVQLGEIRLIDNRYFN